MTIDALGGVFARPYVLACDLFMQAHDFTPPAIALVLGALPPLMQLLMDHFMQESVGIGDQGVMPRWQVERDGAAYALAASADRPAEGHGMRDDDGDRLELAPEVRIIEPQPQLHHR